MKGILKLLLVLVFVISVLVGSVYLGMAVASLIPIPVYALLFLFILGAGIYNKIKP